MLTGDAQMSWRVEFLHPHRMESLKTLAIPTNIVNEKLSVPLLTR